MPRPAATRVVRWFSARGSGPFEHRRVELVGLAVGVDVGARKAGGEEAGCRGRGGGKQLVDEGIFGAAQRGERHRRLGDELGGIERAAVRRGYHQRDGLALRQAAVDRTRDRAAPATNSCNCNTARRVRPSLAKAWGRCRTTAFRRWARSSAVEHCLDMAVATGSIPVAPTIAGMPRNHQCRRLRSLTHCHLRPVAGSPRRRPGVSLNTVSSSTLDSGRRLCHFCTGEVV